MTAVHLCGTCTGDITERIQQLQSLLQELHLNSTIYLLQKIQQPTMMIVWDGVWTIQIKGKGLQMRQQLHELHGQSDVYIFTSDSIEEVLIMATASLKDGIHYCLRVQ